MLWCAVYSNETDSAWQPLSRVAETDKPWELCERPKQNENSWCGEAYGSRVAQKVSELAREKKSANIWRRYGQKLVAYFFGGHPVDRRWIKCTSQTESMSWYVQNNTYKWKKLTNNNQQKHKVRNVTNHKITTQNARCVHYCQNNLT